MAMLTKEAKLISKKIKSNKKIKSEKKNVEKQKTRSSVWPILKDENY